MMESNLTDLQKNFNQSLLYAIDIEKLLGLNETYKCFSDGFNIVLTKFQNLTADIFSCHNFFDAEDSVLYNQSTQNLFIAELFKLISSHCTNPQSNDLRALLISVKELTIKHIDFSSLNEIFTSLLLLFYFYLQENVWGPSFFFIKETEKVDYKKHIEKFNNNYFILLENSISSSLKKDMIDYLTIGGEIPFLHAKLLILYIVVYDLLVKNYEIFFPRIIVASLWKMRILYMQNKLIKEPINELKESVFHIMENEFNLEKEEVKAVVENNLARGMLKLERSFIYLKYYKYKKCEQLIEESKLEFNLKIGLTGKHGRKTKFQDFDSTILVVESQSSTLKQEEPKAITETSEDQSIPIKVGLEESNPLLETPKITDSNDESISTSSQLSEFDQMIVIAQLNYFKHGFPDEDMQREISLTYTNKALEKAYDWLVYSKLLLYRSLAEDKKTKTIERSLLQIQSLCDQYNDRNPIPYSRLKYYFMIDYPLIFWLKKMYAEFFMNYGAVMTAFDIFQELQMDEECIQCLYIGGKTQKAQELAEAMLKRKEDPGIYCILGEIYKKQEYFEKALEITNGKYARAYRCLGKFLMVEGKVDEAIKNYELAMEINPLFPSIWFSLGCLYIKKNNFEKATFAFSKSTGIDDSNSEAWGNLGSCFLQARKSKEAIKCFEEAYKRSRSNWKILENLIYASIESLDLNKLLFAIENLYRLEKQDRVTPEMFYQLIKLFVTNYFGNDYLKGKIYAMFDAFSMKDGATSKIWDLYAFFIESVEIEPYQDKLSLIDLQKIYKSINEIRLKEARSLMIADVWDQDEIMIQKVSCVISKIKTEISRISDVNYVREVEAFVTAISGKIEKFYKVKNFNEKLLSK